MASEDSVRLADLPRHLLVAADANYRLGEFKAALAQYTALQELLPCSGAEATAKRVAATLALPEVFCAGLLRKEECADGSGTAWLFDQEDPIELPLTGVQTDSRSCCPLVRSSPRVMEAAMTLASVSSADTVVDLGCGDGRLLVHVATRVGARAIGFDVNPWCLRTASKAAEAAGVGSRVQVVEHSFLSFTEHPCFKDATVVYVYAMPHVVERLQPTLRQAVAAGKRVLVYCTSSDCTPGSNGCGTMTPSAVALSGKLRLYT